MTTPKLSPELEQLWRALPSWRGVLYEGVYYVYTQRGKPGSWKLIHLSSLTRAEKAEIIAQKPPQIAPHKPGRSKGGKR